MPRNAQPRKPFTVSDSLNRRLSTYAQVASAAGVSVLALASVADATVVYTKTNQVIDGSTPVYIDLNHDGIKDFLLRTTFYVGTAGTQIGLSAAGFDNHNNVIAGQRLRTSGGYFLSAASALHAGAEIGPNGNFSVTSPVMAEELFHRVGNQYSDAGAWAGKGKHDGVKNRYLGLKFVINNEVHYGWARLSVTVGHERQYGDVSGTLTGFAYETEPGKPITAGRIKGDDVVTMPDSLGALALGRK